MSKCWESEMNKINFYTNYSEVKFIDKVIELLKECDEFIFVCYLLNIVD